MKFTFVIGGPQGMGVDTSAHSFARACAYAGYWVFGKREYHSNITGEHSYFTITVSDKQVHTFQNNIDILATFDERTLRFHIADVKPHGAVIYDEEIDITKYKTEKDNILFVPIPYNKIIKETSEKFGLGDIKKIQVMRNSICIFATASLIELDSGFVEKTMEYIFSGKRKKVLEPNRYAGLVAYEEVKRYRNKFHIKMPKIDLGRERLLISGTQATALGKIAAGCRFQTYYPITPATEESEFLESVADQYDFVVIQGEDEIACIALSIGAALTGARASTSTSGPGFSLMMEAIGWAGMNEVPVVVVNHQRGGPSTGLPTRHEQGDLKFAIYGGHGEFPRIVLAPGDIEEAFYITASAFNLAEKYQCPVIILEDKFISNSVKTVDMFDLSKIKIDRGKTLQPDNKSNFTDTTLKKFKRFELVDDNISPRIFLGHPGLIFWNTGDEHDEFGHISEDPYNRLRMHQKRMRKLEKIIEEVSVEEKISIFGDKDSDVVIVSWGSTKGGILTAYENLKDMGYKFLFIQVKMIHPLDADLISEYLNGRLKIAIEQNYSAQLAGYITEKTGIKFDKFILKWTGRPIAEEELTNAIKNAITGNQKSIILSAGL